MNTLSQHLDSGQYFLSSNLQTNYKALFENLKTPQDKESFLTTIIRSFYHDQYTQQRQTPYSEEYIDLKAQVCVAYMASKFGSWDRVKYPVIEHGMLRLYDKDNKLIYTTNLVSLWDNVLKGTPEMRRIEEQTRRDVERLREEVRTESILGGSVIIKYAPIVAGVGVAAQMGASAALNIANYRSARQAIQSGLVEPQVTIREILVRDADGNRKISVPLAGDDFLKRFTDPKQGTKLSYVKSNIIPFLKRWGYEFNPFTRGFVALDRLAFKTASEIVHRLSLRELRSRYGLTTATEEQLLEVRRRLAAGDTEAIKASRGSMLKFMSGTAMHAIMFPIFFSEFTRHQNSSTLAAGVVEWGGFTAGARLGYKAGSIFGAGGKFIGSLAGGMAAVMGLHKGYEGLGGSRLKWQAFNGVDMYDNRRSAILHGINFGVPEVLDWYNHAKASTGLSNTASRSESVDIAVPNLNLTSGLLGRYGRIGWLTGGTGVTPSLPFVQSTVNLGVDPTEWMGGSLLNRNKQQWNMEVTRFREKIKIDILELIYQYQHNKPPFFVQDTKEKKDEIFRNILQGHILGGSGSNFYQLEQTMILQAVLAEFSRWQEGTSPQFIYDIVDNYTSTMYFGELTFANESSRRENESNYLDTDISILAEKVTDITQRQYLMSIFDRMKQKKPLFAPDRVIDGRITLPSPEHTMFNRLLADKTKLMWPPYLDPDQQKEMEVGAIFAHLLDAMSDHVTRAETMQRLSQINDTENGAHWRELELAQDLTGTQSRPTSYGWATSAIHSLQDALRIPREQGSRSVMDQVDRVAQR